MVRQRRRVPLAYLGVADARGVAVLEQLAAAGTVGVGVGAGVRG